MDSIKICKGCNNEFKAWKNTLVFCSNVCEKIYYEKERQTLTKFWEKTNKKLLEKGYRLLEDNGTVLEQEVWDLYVLTGNLRDVLEEVHPMFTDHLDLRRVQRIVNLWKYELKKKIFATDVLHSTLYNNRIKKWSINNIGTIPKGVECFNL